MREGLGGSMIPEAGVVRMGWGETKREGSALCKAASRSWQQSPQRMLPSVPETSVAKPPAYQLSSIHYAASAPMSPSEARRARDSSRDGIQQFPGALLHRQRQG